MLNIGGGEIALILIVALLLLGPKRMPELARGLGKFLREFRRQTDDVRTLVEREFYSMDEDVQPRAAAGGVPPKAKRTPVVRRSSAASANSPSSSSPVSGVSR